MKRLKRLLTISAAVIALVVATMPAGASAASARVEVGGGELTLVHGVPGEADFPVDITVKGRYFGFEQTFEGVTFGTVAPVAVPFDRYTVAIRAAGADKNSPPVLKTRTWVGFRDKAVVAHLDGEGSPMISKFNNTTVLLYNGRAQVTVRHLAAAPAVDIIANDALTLIDGLSNPDEAKVRVPAGTYNVKVAADADNNVVVFDSDLTFASGTNTIIYAVGSLAGETFTPLVQVKNALYTVGNAPR